MSFTQQERAFFFLKCCTQFDDKECASLLRAAGDPEKLLAAPEKFIASVIKDARKGLYMNNCPPIQQADEVCRTLERKGYFAVTLASDDYPAQLKEIPDPPLILFGAGNRALLKERKFCIVGSRSTPAWAEAQAKRVSEELSGHFVIVTGLAEGGDLAAINGALDSGNLISVLPCGLDECYPAAHAALKEKIIKKGLLLSEYPLKEQTHPYSFYARNRILAGLSEGVLVVSAGERSGTAITANCALDYGRDVFAFPYNPGIRQGVGCNELIKKGASLVTDPQDILLSYRLEQKGKASVPLTGEEQRILAILRDAGELHAAVLAERSGLQVYEVAAALSALEMKNLAVKSGGNKYAAL